MGLCTGSLKSFSYIHLILGVSYFLRKYCNLGQNKLKSQRYLLLSPPPPSQPPPTPQLCFPEIRNELREAQGAEELFVMENKVKILLPNERVAFVYCRIYYELDLPNSHAIVLLTW